MKINKRKLTTIDEITDKVIGPKGSQKRNEFEYELQLDVIGQLIRESRLKQKLTQEELGKLLGIGKSQISKIENSTKDFRIGTIMKVMQALNLRMKIRLEEEETGELISIN